MFQHVGMLPNADFSRAQGLSRRLRQCYNVTQITLFHFCPHKPPGALPVAAFPKDHVR
jgi:hypothetical protein